MQMDMDACEEEFNGFYGGSIKPPDIESSRISSDSIEILVLNKTTLRIGRIKIPASLSD